MAQSSVFRGVSRSVVEKSDETLYCYHGTPVVALKLSGDIVLNSGGWRSNTTKLAMNQVSNQCSKGFGVYQEKNVWYVEWKSQVYEFFDGMVLRPDGFVANADGGAIRKLGSGRREAVRV